MVMFTGEIADTKVVLHREEKLFSLWSNTFEAEFSPANVNASKGEHNKKKQTEKTYLN